MLQPHLLIARLNDFKDHPLIIKWYYSFLTNRRQRVGVNGTSSEFRTLSTGAPQGCVSSPVFFTLYTDECRRQYYYNRVIKFSDDTAILGLLKKKDWCEDNHLALNVNKTREMVFDPRGVGDHRPVMKSSYRCLHINVLRSVLIIHSHGIFMQIIFVVGYNNGCTLWCGPWVYDNKKKRA